MIDDITRSEAATWFAALRRNAMSIEERASFEQWRADAKNQAALSSMYELWGEVSAVKSLGLAPAAAKPRWKFAAAAAVALTICGTGALAFYGIFDSRERAVTGIGEQRTATLSDGSIVALNVATSLNYRIDAAERSVELDDGEAVFFVSKDPERPFRVTVGDYTVRAVGTAFNVRRRGDATEVAVMEGVVAIQPVRGGEELVRLSAGQRIHLNPATEQRVAVRPVDIETVAEWRMHVVTYEDIPVANMVEDINRFFPKPITVRDASLSQRRVTMRLEVGDRDQTLGTLSKLLDAKVERGTEADILVPASP